MSHGEESEIEKNLQELYKRQVYDLKERNPLGSKRVKRIKSKELNYWLMIQMLNFTTRSIFRA